ncbi:MAG: c-type cytochrome [Balneolaceae bacterium]|nr:c-type cytochrome [Balneolaceae bacterium]
MKEGSKVNESSAFASISGSSTQDGFFLKSSKVLVLLVVTFLLASCRGEEFSHQPVHPNMNMDQQNRFEAQEENSFFADNRSMRQPVEGTISRGNLRQNPEYYQGINADSSFVANNPVDVTKAFIYRGRDQYNVYCTPCHGKVGAGQGIIMTGRYGYVPAPSFHIDRLRNIEDGYIYSTISNGIRNMPSYAHQIKVEDRWAIVAYVRALQRSQNATEEQLKEYNVDLAGLQQQFTEQQEAEEAQQQAQEGGGEVSVERGEKLYVANGCQACHSRDGSDGIGPTHQNLMGRTEQLADGSSVTVDEEYLRESIVNPSAKIVEGYDPVMAPYSYLSESELNSIIEYLKSL